MQFHEQSNEYNAELVAHDVAHCPNIKTKVGVDAIFEQTFSAGVQPACFFWVAISKNATAVSASSTTLSEEIVTSEGGLIRKNATYAHTTGTATATLTVTFTANTHDALPITVKKFAIFNKEKTGGTMCIETLLTEATFSAAGDNATLTETLELT